MKDGEERVISIAKLIVHEAWLKFKVNMLENNVNGSA